MISSITDISIDDFCKIVNLISKVISKLDVNNLPDKNEDFNDIEKDLIEIFRSKNNMVAVSKFLTTNLSCQSDDSKRVVTICAVYGNMELNSCFVEKNITLFRDEDKYYIGFLPYNFNELSIFLKYDIIKKLVKDIFMDYALMLSYDKIEPEHVLCGLGRFVADLLYSRKNTNIRSILSNFGEILDTNRIVLYSGKIKAKKEYFQSLITKYFKDTLNSPLLKEDE